MNSTIFIDSYEPVLEQLHKMSNEEEMNQDHAIYLVKILNRCLKRNPDAVFPREIFKQADFVLLLDFCLNEKYIDTHFHKALYRTIINVIMENPRYNRSTFIPLLIDRFNHFCNLFDSIPPSKSDMITKVGIFNLMSSLMHEDSESFVNVYEKFNIEMASELFHDFPCFCNYLYNLVKNPSIEYESMPQIVNSIINHAISIIPTISITSKKENAMERDRKLSKELRRMNDCLLSLNSCTRFPEIFFEVFQNIDIYDRYLNNLMQYKDVFSNVVKLSKSILQIKSDFDYDISIFGIVFMVSHILEQLKNLSKWINIAEDGIYLLTLLSERKIYNTQIDTICDQMIFNKLIQDSIEIGCQQQYLQLLCNLIKDDTNYIIVSDESSLKIALNFLNDDNPVFALEFILIRAQKSVSQNNFEDSLDILDESEKESINELIESEDEKISILAQNLSDLIASYA